VAGGAEVRVGQPSAAPSDLTGWAAYDSVVLEDVPSDALPQGALEQLETYVRDLGRGLGMVGGPTSFGIAVARIARMRARLWFTG